MGAAVLGLAALAALFAQCAGPKAELVATNALEGAAAETAAPGIPSPVASPVIEATPAPTLVAVKAKAKATPKPAAKKSAAKAPVRKKKKLRADVDPADFVVSGVEVSERGYTAKVDGWIRLTRKNALAQPLLEFDLEDGHGRLIHSGTFTPVDATGPIWLGYDALGLKRVPFSTTVDLRGDTGVLPAIPPRPYSASVRVAEVIDAKPAK